MMGMDGARAADPIVKISPGEGVVSARKKKKPEGGMVPKSSPVFSSEEHDLKIQVPEGWRSV
jgi:hypothetical protein